MIQVIDFSPFGITRFQGPIRIIRLIKAGRESIKQLAVGQLGFPVTETVVPVVSFSLGKAEVMERVHDELMNRGIVIQLSHYVGAGPAGVLRAVVFATHTNEQIDRLLSSLKALI